jgi:Restriction endonuclease
LRSSGGERSSTNGSSTCTSTTSPGSPSCARSTRNKGFLADDDPTDVDSEQAAAGPASHWLSPDEWRALPSAERNQLALDRYLRSRKTNWQVGRDYERYIGYLREQAGFRVTYHGIIKGFEDLGRDLIAERRGEVEVIQCKRWSHAKLIHEKHVFQLFGTMFAHRIENPGRPVRGTFVTSTRLSDRALAFARELDISVEQEVPLADYPRIKCNVARETGERIYHLPFDRAYDATVIEPERGEFYAASVEQSEKAGFRRAFRWHGQEIASAPLPGG